jgi:DNA-3-methyladenine glycosylase II
LNRKAYAEGLRYLAASDADLARIFAELGTPPEWFRAPEFSTLIHIILEQQVSLASAEAAFKRLLALASPLTPARFLELDDAELKRAGFSRQKTAYGRHLARAIMDGELDLEALCELDDAAVKAELLKVKGIGAWTADIYLLRALGRPDAWPAGDLALLIAVQELKRLAARPTPSELEVIAERWRPHRAVAARLLWHYYLQRRA